jgi:hypothetical protein
VAIFRGLAISFEPDDPGLCAAIEIALEREDVDAATDGPGGDLLQVLGRSHVVLVCRKPGDHPYIGRARLCDQHHEQMRAPRQRQGS